MYISGKILNTCDRFIAPHGKSVKIHQTVVKVEFIGYLKKLVLHILHSSPIGGSVLPGSSEFLKKKGNAQFPAFNSFDEKQGQIMEYIQ